LRVGIELRVGVGLRVGMNRGEREVRGGAISSLLFRCAGQFIPPAALAFDWRWEGNDEAPCNKARERTGWDANASTGNGGNFSGVRGIIGAKSRGESGDGYQRMDVWLT
jgi:hypothetical protein